MNDLFDQLGDVEHEALEFKQDLSERDQVRRAICALANDLPGVGSGVLLIGVKDDGQPSGIAVDDELLRSVVEFRDDGLILPRPVLRVERGVFKGADVAVVTVSATEYPPVRFRGDVIVRVGPSSRRATAGEERRLTERRRAIDLPFDQHAVFDAELSDLDMELFRSAYLPAAVSPEALEENHRDVAQQLASLRLATLDGVPTVAGVVVLGLDPSAHLSGSYVQFVRYEGADPDSPVQDDAELRGNVVDQLADLNIRLPANLRSPLREEGMAEQQVADYPMAALREAVVNALVHRSYESRAPVRILWFDDRVEISNPGGPFGVVDETNYDTSTDYRNPTLAEAAKNLGYMNRFGRGIARIRSALERNGNPPPRFEIAGSQWSVTFVGRTG